MRYLLSTPLFQAHKISLKRRQKESTSQRKDGEFCKILLSGYDMAITLMNSSSWGYLHKIKPANSGIDGIDGIQVLTTPY